METKSAIAAFCPPLSVASLLGSGINGNVRINRFDKLLLFAVASLLGSGINGNRRTLSESKDLFLGSRFLIRKWN